MGKQCFIRVRDAETIEAMRNLGFKEIPDTGDGVLFINDSAKFEDSALDADKLNFTNITNI